MYCKHCMKMIPDGTQICPNCGKSQIKKKPIYKKWWFILILVFVVCSIIGSITPHKNGRIEYVVMAEDLVDDALKAPTTAEFCDPSECTIRIYERKSDCLVIVEGYVDSQNGFGVMIRNNYAVEMQVSGENYKGIYMKIGDNEYGNFISGDFVYMGK